MRTEKYNLYWGEIHNHTFCGNISFGNIEDAVNIARGHLDFWAPGEHYNFPGEERPHPMFNWDKISRVVAENYEPGKFVTFPGFEFARENGDYNLYLCRDIPVLPGIKDYPELFAFARRENAIVIPHHIGYKVGCRGMRWDWFDPAIMPLVEIFSMHGSSEDERGPFPLDLPWMGPRETGGTALSGLQQGHVFGFIASSDGHNAYPGSYKMGLAAVYAEELTRESIWSAMRARRTYAVTGDRILLNFELEGQPMGSVCTSGKARSILVEVEGLDALDKIELIKNGRVLWRECASLNRDYDYQESGKFKVRIEWGWGSSEPWQAEGKLSLQGGNILSAVPCFAAPGPNELTLDAGNSAAWKSVTIGNSIFDWKIGRYAREGTNSIVFTIQGNGKTILELKLNGRIFRYSLADLMQGSRVELTRGPFDQKVKFHEPISEDQYYKSINFTDTASHGAKQDFYYVRITQANGQMAWSSPIWVNTT